MFELSDELTAIAILGSARGSRVGSAASPKRSDCGSSRVGLKVRDREDAIASTVGRVRSHSRATTQRRFSAGRYWRCHGCVTL